MSGFNLPPGVSLREFEDPDVAQEYLEVDGILDPIRYGESIKPEDVDRVMKIVDALCQKAYSGCETCIRKANEESDGV